MKKLKSYKTAAGRLYNAGRRAAQIDIRGGWITKTEILEDEAGIRSQLIHTIGAGKSFQDGYISAAK